MNKRPNEKKLRDKRFKKSLLRKEFHQFNLKGYHRRQAFFNASFGKNRYDFIDRPSPDVFSILDNREQTISYLNRIDNLLHNKTRVHMDFSKIKYTDMPTVCVLSAYMVDPRTPGKFLQVSIPHTNTPQRKIWNEAQFENTILRDHELNFGTGGFISRSSNRIHNELIEGILDSTVKYFGPQRKMQLRDLSAIINELAENTVLHADKQGVVGNLRWLINSRDVEGDNKKIREYCLVDLGVGVYDSIMKNVIRWNTKRHKLKHRLSSIMDENITQDIFLSRQIPKGIGSSTNQASRGKGIRHVYDIAQSSIYDKFDIITNKAQVNLKDNSMINDDSSQSFFGTVYYWRISFDD